MIKYNDRTMSETLDAFIAASGHVVFIPNNTNNLREIMDRNALMSDLKTLVYRYEKRLLELNRLSQKVLELEQKLAAKQ